MCERYSTCKRPYNAYDEQEFLGHRWVAFNNQYDIKLNGNAVACSGSNSMLSFKPKILSCLCAACYVIFSSRSIVEPKSQSMVGGHRN